MSSSDESWDPRQHPKAAMTPARGTERVTPTDAPATATTAGDVPGEAPPAGAPAPKPRSGRARRAKAGPPVEVILVAVIVVMLLAIGAGAWFQRDRIAAMLGGAPEEPSAQQVPLTPAAPPPVAASQPSAPAAQTPEPAVEPAPTGGETAAAPPVVEPPAAPVLPEGPVVIFIEEPQGGVSEGIPAIESVGQPTWRFVPASAAGPARVEVDVVVPDRGMDLGMSITEIDDAGFPASHLVELTVRSSDVVIADVGQMTAKPELRGRPQPFDAAGTKVADGLFWIALSDAPEAVETNAGLLRNEAYIDVLMTLEGERRAILTIAVGDEGRQAIDQALAAWGAG